jgi:DNA-binding transcriptional LysR family regulator
MFDWNDLRYFLAVARQGSTLAAARAIPKSQSTVHRRLEALEASLERPLVKRHPSGYRLTPFGIAMLPYAEEVERAVAIFEQHQASL